MIEDKNIVNPILPEPTVRRLPWYLAYVNMLRLNNIEYVSSTQISKEIDVDASQIAKDLSFINIKGKTRIGYEVNELVSELSDFLGFTEQHNAFMIGVGNLGAALISDQGLQQYGLNIVAGFDCDKSIIGKNICGVPIYSVDEMPKYTSLTKTEIGILAVPVENAQEAADAMIDSGIKAIWNFTPYRIKTPKDIVIQNTSIYSHLAVMYNRLHELDKENTK